MTAVAIPQHPEASVHPARRLVVLVLAVAASGATYLATGAGAQASTGTVTGVVFNDANRNGVRDAGESPFSGVFVDLVSSSGSVSTATTTDITGAYQFSGLADCRSRVFLDPDSWNGMNHDWTPTTTNTLQPSRD